MVKVKDEVSHFGGSRRNAVRKERNPDHWRMITRALVMSTENDMLPQISTERKPR